MCQVRTGTYVSLLAPENTDCIACHPEKDYHVYITRGISLRIRTSDSVQLEKRKRKESEEGKEKKQKEDTRRGSN